MELAYQGEITTPSRCGRMDQGCAFGNRAVLMDVRRRPHGHERDAGRRRTCTSSSWTCRRKKDTIEILNRLNRCYPFAESDVERGVQELLGPINKRIVHQAVEALRAGDARAPRRADDRGAGVLRPLRHARLPRGADRAGAAPRAQLRAARSRTSGAARASARRATARRSSWPAAPADQQAVIEIIERDLGMPCLTLTLAPGPEGAQGRHPGGRASARACSRPPRRPRRSCSRSSTATASPSPPSC